MLYQQYLNNRENIIYFILTSLICCDILSWKLIDKWFISYLISSSRIYRSEVQ